MKKNLGNLTLFLYLFILTNLSATPLVDSENSFPITPFEWEYLRDILLGVFIFLAGFLTAYFKIFEKLKEKLSTR